MISITLDDRTVEAAKGQTVLDAASDHGIVVPTLCYHKDLSGDGSCRLCMVEISPGDAVRLHVNGDSYVRVWSRRGQMTARAVITDRVSEGVIFGNFHFPSPYNVNNVTICALDPVAKIPEYKVCAVALEPL